MVLMESSGMVSMQSKLLKPFFIFLILLLSACDEDLKYSALPADAVILAFGDSLTAGYGASKAQSYPAELQKLTNLKVINAGKSGELSNEGLRRLPSELDRHQPALLILCHGGNDILRKHNLTQTRANIEQMILLAQSRQIKVMLLAVPRPSLLLSPVPFYQQIAESTGALFDASIMPTVLGKREFKSDTIHPNAAGYAEIARRITSRLISSGLINSDS